MFKVVGLTTFKGKTKVRFGTDLVRVKKLTKEGHTDIELRELPQAMEKPGAVAWLKTSELYQDPRFTEAIDMADAKYNGEKTVRVPRAKTKKVDLEEIRSRAVEADASAAE